MQTLEKQVRFYDLARAFRVLASRPDKSLDVALEVVDDNTIKVIESNLHNIAAKLNGDPMAREIEALLSHPMMDSPPMAIVHARDVAKEGELPPFNWKAIQKPGAPLGDLNAAFECTWGGQALKIVKNGAADYEGFIGGVHFARSKFKKSMRERLEKEAIKRANA